jgi:hypothetical protein
MCGGIALLVPSGRKRVWVTCTSCRCATDEVHELKAKKAVEKWNRRAPITLDQAKQVLSEVGMLAVPVLDDVVGDVMPPVGSTVKIHLASTDEWVDTTVIGYYAWGDLDGNESLHRLFVRVQHDSGVENVRLLKDVRRSKLEERCLTQYNRQTEGL